MILVLLGTQNNSFHRLLEQIEKNIENGNITEEVVVQAGFTKYESKNMKIFDLIPSDQFDELINKCDLLITHGGVGSILAGVTRNKKVIAAPRLAKYNEHVNDHQLEFALAVQERYGNICVIDEIDKLEKSILDYDFLVSKQSKEMTSNNLCFNKELEEIVLQLFAE